MNRILVHLPPFLFWPYVIFRVLTRRPIWNLLHDLTAAERSYLQFYDVVIDSLNDACDDSSNICRNFLEGDYFLRLVRLALNGFIIFYGGIFAFILDVYVHYRYISSGILWIMFYWFSFMFEQPDRE